jgi:RNA 3'-terminal phosphate cyclase
MVFQSLLPVLIMKGLGAHVHFKNERSDPLFDYMQFIFLPFASRHCGIQYQFYRDHIGGDIDLTIYPDPKTLKPFTVLDAAAVCRFAGVMWGNVTNDATVLSLPSSALKDAVQRELNKFYPNIPISFLDRGSIPLNSKKVGVLLYAETIEGYRIAATVEFEDSDLELSNFEERVTYHGSKLVRKLRIELAHKGVVDEHLADQLILIMALATSRDTSAHGAVGRQKCTILTGPLSLHTLTAMKISETLLGDIEFLAEDRSDRSLVVICKRREGK